MTVAIATLLLVHVPPVDGLNVDVSPIHNSVSPVTLTVGPVVTVTTLDVSEIQPVEVCVKINRTLPTETPVIIPALVIVAMAGLVLTQVPPVVGEILVVAPTHIEDGPLTTVTGLGFTVTAAVAKD